MRVGAVLVTQTHCIHIGKLTPLLSDDELWSHDPQRTRTTICTATPDKKGLLLWKLFPTHNPHTFLTLILSNSTLVVISWSHPSAPGENTISSSHVVTITPRASWSRSSKSEPRPSTNIHSKPVRPALVSSPPNPLHPTRVMVEGHTFWRQSAKRFPVHSRSGLLTRPTQGDTKSLCHTSLGETSPIHVFQRRQHFLGIVQELQRGKVFLLDKQLILYH